jgi:hypothetical protein
MAGNVITSEVDVVMCVILSKATKRVCYGELVVTTEGVMLYRVSL